MYRLVKVTNLCSVPRIFELIANCSCVKDVSIASIGIHSETLKF